MTDNNKRDIAILRAELLVVAAAIEALEAVMDICVNENTNLWSELCDAREGLADRLEFLNAQAAANAMGGAR